MILHRIFRKILSQFWFYYYQRIFKNFGKMSRLDRPYMLTSPQCITIGSHVLIRAYSRIEAITSFAGTSYSPNIYIDDGAHIELSAHISAYDSVRIGKRVVLAGHVYLSDHDHGFEDIDTPIMQQPLRSKGPVVIGDDCWLGEGSTVTSGVTLGRHVIVGANSVVVRSVPDYCVVAGSPARIIRKYNVTTKSWERVVHEP
jgi:acetyltransferase-like isoleucine patch superfamily enzyme